MRIDRKRLLTFAPLEGRIAAELSDKLPQSADSIVYIKNGHVFTESTAALRILGDIGGVWKVSAIGFILPKLFRDKLYRFIAKNRYGWFGKMSSCRIPTEAEKERFLE